MLKKIKNTLTGPRWPSQSRRERERLGRRERETPLRLSSPSRYSPLPVPPWFPTNHSGEVRLPPLQPSLALPNSFLLLPGSLSLFSILSLSKPSSSLLNIKMDKLRSRLPEFHRRTCAGVLRLEHAEGAGSSSIRCEMPPFTVVELKCQSTIVFNSDPWCCHVQHIFLFKMVPSIGNESS